MTDYYERIIAADAPPGLYESNYLKGNAPDGSGAFWLKHNVLTPARSGQAPAVAEFWCVLWLADEDWTPRVWKRVVALDRVELGRDRVAMDAGDVRLEPDRVAGQLSGQRSGSRSGDPDVRWDLAIRDELPPLRHLGADWMYEKGFPRKKAVTGSPRAVFDGAFDVGDRTIDVDGWIGHRQHNWGTEHAERYVFGACNIWDDGADLTVEGITVRVELVAGIRSPWLTLLRGLRDGQPYGKGTMWATLRQSGDVDFPRWMAWGGGKGQVRTRLEMELDPEHTAGLRYLHPDGQVSYCYNAKDARTELVLDREVFTSRSGELEFLFPEPIDGIELHGESSLEELADARG